MKEAVTKFDFESAFKALDEIEIPKAGKVKANRPALNEIFSRKTKFDTLIEEYYDISSNTDLEDAQAAREAEVAKAKLERIEKIVDLDADSPEDLLTSYVGKYIIQCPQCMTLFYKDSDDVVESEDDSTVVNVSEICQHCGNDSGYTLIGKVGEAEPGEFEEVPAEPEVTDEEIPEEPTEETPEENNDESADLDDIADLDLDLNLEDDEEEKKEESLMHDGEALVEELSNDNELDAKLEAHNEYIEYLRAAIAQEEEKLEKATNKQVQVAIQRNIDAFKADLEAALPDAVKNDTVLPEESAEENREESENTTASELSDNASEEDIAESLTESLCEEKTDANLDISSDEFEELINSPEFKKPISDSEARALIDAESESEENKEVEESIDDDQKDGCVIEELTVSEGLDAIMGDLDDIQESTLETHISNSLVESYGNVAGFRLNECSYAGNTFKVDGTIYFTSGNTRKTTYAFSEALKSEDKISLCGLNEKLGLNKQFTLTGKVDNKTFITESLTYTTKK